MGTVHVIGGGLSGLSCAVRVAASGQQVALYEATDHAGGRCRSFHDDGLGCIIDNGNHLLLSANHRTRSYIELIGAQNQVTELRPARFDFIEPASDLRWSLKPGSRWFPLWMLLASRRVPGSGLSDYRDIMRLWRAGPNDRVGDCVNQGSALFERFWQPLCQAVLNTDATEASARLLWTFIRLSFLKGEPACRPIIFNEGLSQALVHPALAYLEKKAASVRFQSRVRGLRWENDRVIAIRFPEGLLRVDENDAVVLAVPPEVCADLWPDAAPPDETRSIVNIHFRVDQPFPEFENMPLIGLVGTRAHWIFVKKNVLSVTVSAANELAESPNWEIANMIWAEICTGLGRNMGRLPPWRVIKERRATIAQTPLVAIKRPQARTALKNLFLAGDWTNTGLPATIEGSILSGQRAASLARAITDHKSSE